MAFGAYPLLGFENYGDWSTSTWAVAAGTLSTGSSIEHIQHGNMGRKASFDAGTAVTITLDLGSGLSPQLFAFLGTNFPDNAVSSGVCTITGDDNSDFSSPIYGPTAHNSQSVTTWLNQGEARNCFRVALSSAVAARYWRFAFTFSSTALEIARAYVGPGWQGDGTGNNGGIAYGHSYGVDGLSEEATSDGDTDHRFVRKARRVVDFTIQAMADAVVYDEMYPKLDYALSNARDFLFIHDPTETDLERIQTFTIWGNAEGGKPIASKSYGWWERSVRMKERL